MAREARCAKVLARQISLQSKENSDTSTKKSHCQPTYQLRKLTNKGAILIIIWNFLLASVPHYQIVYVPRGLKISLIAWVFTMPFAGWLADTRFGRYNVIYWSMWIMWIASILVAVNSIVEQFVPGHHNTFHIISQILAFILVAGFGAYQANAIQFGLDQLQDASTTEIIAFISWYCWSYFSSRVVTKITRVCMKEEYQLFGCLLVCISTTIAIISSLTCHRFLIKEPVTRNPLQLVYKIIRYAIRNKHPRHRSAFTYCEDELPSRIDFGKTKYGGPFTTEQVEDVKTFLRLEEASLYGTPLQ